MTAENTTVLDSVDSPDLALVLAESAPHPVEAKAVVKVATAFRRSATTPKSRKTQMESLEGAPRAPGFAPRKKAIDGARRAAVKRALDGGTDVLEIMLDNARWAYQEALQRQRTLSTGIEEAAVMREVIAFRTLAQDCAVQAAPYIHAKLAPKITKGESGLTVNLVIEDA